MDDNTYSDFYVPVIDYSGQIKDNTELNGVISDICAKMQSGYNGCIDNSEYLAEGDKISNGVSYISSRVFPDSNDVKYDLFHPHSHAVSIEYMVYVIAFCKAIGVIDTNPTMQDIRQLFISLTNDVHFDLDTLSALKRAGLKDNMTPYEICRKYNKETMRRDTMLLIAMSEDGDYSSTRLGIVLNIVAELAIKYHDSFEKADNMFGSYCTQQLINRFHMNLFCLDMCESDINSIAVAIGTSRDKCRLNPSTFYNNLCDFFVNAAVQSVA